MRAAGAEIVDVDRAEALIWLDPRHPEGLADLLGESSAIRWVQLPFAGIENFVHLVDGSITWTCGKGVYAEPVAELALALMLAGTRGLSVYARARRWERPIGEYLLGAPVTILGGGGITESLVDLLRPWDCPITVVRRSPQAMDGVAHCVGAEGLGEALGSARFVVLALALTPETVGVIDAAALTTMRQDAWLVNVARGRHVVTDDLVEALRSGAIAGACLDVTEPEPLPEGHPLWSLDNCIITPHVGNTPEMAVPLLARRIRENVERFVDGRPLIGLVDPAAGY